MKLRKISATSGYTPINVFKKKDITLEDLYVAKLNQELQNGFGRDLLLFLDQEEYSFDKYHIVNFHFILNQEEVKISTLPSLKIVNVYVSVESLLEVVEDENYHSSIISFVFDLLKQVDSKVLKRKNQTLLDKAYKYFIPDLYEVNWTEDSYGKKDLKVHPILYHRMEKNKHIYHHKSINQKTNETFSEGYIEFDMLEIVSASSHLAYDEELLTFGKGDSSLHYRHSEAEISRLKEIIKKSLG